MKRLLLSIALATGVSCSMPATQPPGMPLDKELRPGADDTAITKVTG